MALIPDTNLTYRVGECPACGCGLIADVVVRVEVHTPFVTEDGKAKVTANPRLVAMKFAHECDRREGDER